MAVLTLPYRQRLSGRVQFFGSIIPGTPGDPVRDLAVITAAIQSNATADEIYDAKASVDWNAVYALNPERALELNRLVNRGVVFFKPANYDAMVSSHNKRITDENAKLDQESYVVEQSSDKRAEYVATTEKNKIFQPDPPVTGPALPSNTGIPNPPGMSNEEYAALVEKNKTDAAGLETQNALRAMRESAFQEAPVTPRPVINKSDVATGDNKEADVYLKVAGKAQDSKPNPLILPSLAALAAFLILKG